MIKKKLMMKIKMINFNDIIPNHNISFKPRETTLRSRNLRSHINHFNKFFNLKYSI